MTARVSVIHLIVFALLLSGCAHKPALLKEAVEPLPTPNRDRTLLGSIGYDTLSYEKGEIESRSWESDTHQSMRFLSWGTLTFPANQELRVAFYGADTNATCVDFYLRAGTTFLLLAHDVSLVPIKEVRPEIQGSRAFVRVIRSSPRVRVVSYAYELTPGGDLTPTVSTLISR